MSAPNSASVPQAFVEKGYGASSAPRSQLANLNTAAEFGSAPGQSELSPLSQTAQQQYGRFNEEWDASRRGSSILDSSLQRSNSGMSQGETLAPSRGGTLKKKASLKRGASLKRSSSRRSSRAGSVRSLALQPSGEVDEMNSAFYSPVPTSGSPTDILANRFQAWRKVLKDLITFYREMQTHYDHKAKSLLKVANAITTPTAPSPFMASGVVDEALQIMRNYHKFAIAESTKSRDIENDVILALVGLRSDLSQKIKEIKSLSGDFKNSVEKEMENTRRAVHALQDGLGQSDIDPSQGVGKQDPYLLKLAADRQIEKQIDEENYLHQAYLNLEASGRELEAIVVGEIQKSYNAYAGILKREGDAAYATVEELRTGPVAMPKDYEWNAFVEKDEHFVDPRVPVRSAENINYPGRDNELAQEVRAGLLERKSKYLKSYTAGWYVLSPTHLHEFKSADKTQAPIMSLYLPEQKLGSHSAEGSSSNKFMLKGRQTGSMHRGHSWVFRAESWDTMQAWVSDIQALTDKTPQERNAFVRRHARSVSSTSQKAASVSSDGLMDEEDEEPFSASASSAAAQTPKQDVLPRRPQPGGRFPSDLKIDVARGLQAPLSPSSGSSGFGDVRERDVTAAATDGAAHRGSVGQFYAEDPAPTHAAIVNQYAQEDGINPYTGESTAAASALGASASEAYLQYGEPSAVNDMPAHQQPHETVAAVGSLNIASPDTFAQESERQAAHEAIMVAADDAPAARTAPAQSQAILGDGSARDGYLPGTAVLAQATVESPVPPLPVEAPIHIASVEAPVHQVPVDAPIQLATLVEAPIPVAAKDESAAATNGAPPAPHPTVRHGSVQSISQLHVPGEYR